MPRPLLVRRAGLMSSTHTVAAPVVASVAANSFEGIANGAAVTTANSGGSSGTAFDAVSSLAGQTLTVDNTHTAHGSRSLEVGTGATSGPAYVQWTFGATDVIYLRAYYYLTAFPSASSTMARLYAGTSADASSVNLSTAGKMRLLITAGVDCQLASVIPLNQMFRLEAKVDATTGGYEIRRYDTPDSPTPSDVQTSVGSPIPTGLQSIRWGYLTSGVNLGPYWADDLAIGTAGWLGAAA